jgi:hypothetical protein
MAPETVLFFLLAVRYTYQALAFSVWSKICKLSIGDIAVTAKY